MQYQMIQDVKQQILYMNDLENLIGRSRSTIRRWWLEGKFPPPTKLNGTNLAWHTEVIQEWINLNTKMH